MAGVNAFRRRSARNRCGRKYVAAPCDSNRIVSSATIIEALGGHCTEYNIKIPKLERQQIMPHSSRFRARARVFVHTIYGSILGENRVVAQNPFNFWANIITRWEACACECSHATASAACIMYGTVSACQYGHPTASTRTRPHHQPPPPPPPHNRRAPNL